MSIYTEFNESHSRPADESDGLWTAEQNARFAAARAVTVAMAEARRAAKATAGATPAPPPTLEQRHAQALAGFAQVRTIAKLDEWARWAKGFPFSELQEDALEDAYHRNKARLAPAPA